MMTLDLAKKMIEGAEKKAIQIKVPMCITVVDVSGVQVAAERMDNAFLVSIQISKDKAYTAIGVQQPTHQLMPAVQPGQSLYGLNTSDGCHIVVFGGGFPVKDKDGKLIGGIGVSGGSVDEDMDCAQAGLKALGW